jgi:predicted ATPase
MGAAHVQPLVIVIEDLHWADPSTLELIQLLASKPPSKTSMAAGKPSVESLPL